MTVTLIRFKSPVTGAAEYKKVHVDLEGISQELLKKTLAIIFQILSSITEVILIKPPKTAMTFPINPISPSLVTQDTKYQISQYLRNSPSFQSYFLLNELLCGFSQF